MYKYLFFLFFFISCENPFLDEQKEYDLFGFQNTCDGNYDVCGECNGDNSTCEFVNLNNDITSVGNDILITSNNEFLITGYQKNSGEPNIWIELIQEDGLSTSKILGGINAEYGFDAIEMNDGNFLILGSTNSYGEGDYDIIVYKLNSSLEEINYFTLGTTNYDGAASITQTFDENFIILSSSRPINSGNYNIIIDKIDSNGNIIKNDDNEELHYSIGNDLEQIGHHIIEGLDSTIYFSGYSQSNRELAGLWFGKLDENFNIACEINFGNGNFEDLTSQVIETSDSNELIIAGTYNNDIIIANIDKDCNLNWKKYFGSTNNDIFTSIINIDNGFIISAISESSDNGKNVVWLFQIDDLGNIVWEKIIEYKNNINAFDLINNNDESITLTGFYEDENDLKGYYLTIPIP